MPFPCQGLSPALCTSLDAFMRNNNMAALYRAYAWARDTYAAGFPDIQQLELRLGASELSSGITLKDAVAVAIWGAMRNQSRIAGSDIVLPANTLMKVSGVAHSYIQAKPQEPLKILALIKGFGPTYRSKVLRFALPEEYGAIDTRLVRVFGQGDAQAKQHDWLDLAVREGTHRGKPTGWFIPETQVKWPTGYAQWINILRYMAGKIVQPCPHPESFLAHGLRQQGVWTCADVEMALFCYASQYV